MDKFIVKLTPKEKGYRGINIRMDDYETICQIKEDTGISIADIVGSMIRFCAARLEVEEE